MAGLLARLSGYERVEAVHETFQNKSSDEALTILFWLFVLLTGFLAVLTISHRIQNYLRHREAARKPPLSRPPPIGDLPKFGTTRPPVDGYTQAQDIQSPSVRQ